MKRRTWLGRALTPAAILFIAACSVPPRGTGQKLPELQIWSGRLSLNLVSEPPQSFSASFELKGHAGEGELIFISPLGNILATLQWSPGVATLRTGQDTQQFGSLEMLASRVTGTPLPIRELFDWLDGVNTTAAGWHADLSRLEQGRLAATRTDPTPAAELRLLLDR